MPRCASTTALIEGWRQSWRPAECCNSARAAPTEPELTVRLPQFSVDAIGRAPVLGALIPEIVRRGYQDLLEAEVSALTSAQLNERRPDQRSTLRNG